MLSGPGSRRHSVVDPSDGSVLATVTEGDVDDAEHAVAGYRQLNRPCFVPVLDRCEHRRPRL